MKIIHLATPLTGDGTTLNPRRPAAADKFNLRIWSEVSGGDPCTIAAVVEEPVVAAIQEDNEYGEAAILEISEVPPDIN